ncbi:HNH endonuclease [Janibacter limosus]|uniref:HNH nuclease domain-containing protein n=1 Tax=Janibacter limosus TaxID=53458 RepID=A0A4P6MXK8_9MICO|nr:hypothetical protein EXU32_09085 [Janibacter limosus]
MSTASDAEEFRTSVPPEHWARIDVDRDTGCWRAVRGARSGCGARYPATTGGRLLHRVLWEAEHGPTSKMLVHVVCGDRLCVRPDHCREMDWNEMHLHHRGSWANRRPSGHVQAISGPSPPNHPPESAPARHEASTRSAGTADRP